jgi:hypothetical protein
MMYFEKSWLFIQEDDTEKSYAAIGKRAAVLLSQVGEEIGMRKKNSWACRTSVGYCNVSIYLLLLLDIYIHPQQRSHTGLAIEIIEKEPTLYPLYVRIERQLCV